MQIGDILQTLGKDVPAQVPGDVPIPRVTDGAVPQAAQAEDPTVLRQAGRDIMTIQAAGRRGVISKEDALAGLQAVQAKYGLSLKQMERLSQSAGKLTQSFPGLAESDQTGESKLSQFMKNNPRVPQLILAAASSFSRAPASYNMPGRMVEGFRSGQEQGLMREKLEMEKQKLMQPDTKGGKWITGEDGTLQYITPEQSGRVKEQGELSYHIEKEQINNKQIQDYRVFTDKQGNIVRREKVGEPYANSEAVAETRSSHLRNIPISAVPGLSFDRRTGTYSRNGVSLSAEEVEALSLMYQEKKPTNDIKVMRQSAPSVMHLAEKATTLLDDIEKGLGPAASRWRDLWSGKVGASDPKFRELVALTNLLTTRLMKMHTGARGGEYIMQHFKEIIEAGKDSPQNLRSALRTIQAYANEAGRPIQDQMADYGLDGGISDDDDIEWD